MGREGGEQKFFGSFFQKRTCLLQATSRAEFVAGLRSGETGVWRHLRARMQVSARDLATMAREAEIMTLWEDLEGSFIVPARLDGERNRMTGGGKW